MVKKPDVPYIIEALRPLAVKIADLVPDPENARKHSKRDVADLRESLSTFGQYLPLVAQKQGMILRVGNARLAAAVQLGWEYLAVAIVDQSKVRMTALAIADNRTGERGSWDETALHPLLSAIAEDDPDVFDATGFSRDALAKMERLEEPAAVPNPDSGPAEPDPPPDATGVELVTLFIEREDHPWFLETIEKLSGEYGVQCVTDAVFEALKRERDRIVSDGVPLV